ncbi:hypothetical protein AKO1_014413, partial [Acrasis kona]
RNNSGCEILFVLLLCCLLIKARLPSSGNEGFKKQNFIHIRSGSIGADSEHLLDVNSLASINEEKIQVLIKFAPVYETQFGKTSFKYLTEEYKKKIREEFGIKLSSYIPHHSYIAVATPEQISKISAHEHVDFVAHYKPHMKVSTLEHKDINEHMKETASISASLVPDQERTLRDAEQIKDQIKSILDNNNIPHQHLLAASKNKIIAVVHKQHFAQAAKALSTHVQVHWIEQHDVHAQPENAFNRKLIQTNKQQSEPYSIAGLKGKGQVVAYGDSGLDVYSCFFHDQDHRVPFVNAKNLTSHL